MFEDILQHDKEQHECPDCGTIYSDSDYCPVCHKEIRWKFNLLPLK